MSDLFIYISIIVLSRQFPGNIFMIDYKFEGT